MKALGAYCYAGGFTLGISEMFSVSCHLEDEKPYAARTALRNLSGHLGDLDIIPETPFLDHPWGGHELAQRHLIVGEGCWSEEYDLIYGNPPCAAWSQAGRRLDNWRTDHRVECTRKHLQLLKLHRPRVWVWETIHSTWKKGREFVDVVAEQAMQQGYHVTALLHDAKWVGPCPQDRERLFVVASRHRPFFPDRPDPAEARKSWDAAALLDGLNDKGNPYSGPEEKHLYLWDLAKPGDKLAQVYDEHFLPDEYKDENGRKLTGIPPQKGRPGFLLRRLHDKGPAFTVIAPMFHHRERRLLTDKEMAALCGYPTWWEWSEDGRTTNASISEIARGVCPSVAKWLGIEIYHHLKQPATEQMPSYACVNMLNEETERYAIR